MPEIQFLGASLIALSPEKSADTIKTHKRNKLGFDLLSDRGNKTAKDFGLVFRLSDHVNEIYKGYDIDLQKSNGDDRQELPLPATYVIDSSGQIVYTFVNSDYKVRVSKDELMAVLGALKKLNTKSTRKAAKGVKEALLKISGMTCGHCSKSVTKKLMKLEGMKTARVDHESGSAKISYDSSKLSQEKIIKQVSGGGFKVTDFQ